MSVLADFFRGSDTHFGIFCPRRYLIAVFPDLAAAQWAEKRLLNAGIPGDHVVAVPGDDLVQLSREHLKTAGVGTLLMQGLSRMFETEEVYADHDLDLASRGAGFLAVYCPTESRKKNVWRLIEPAAPLVARHYSFGGVEHLRGET